jgi:hypothetical protein
MIGAVMPSVPSSHAIATSDLLGPAGRGLPEQRSMASTPRRRRLALQARRMRSGDSPSPPGSDTGKRTFVAITTPVRRDRS